MRAPSSFVSHGSRVPASPASRASRVSRVSRVLLAGVVASLGAMGCASSAQDPSAEPSDEAESEVRASCTNPRRYFATYREGSGTCEPIAGSRGRWMPRPLFADAPADVQASTCTYEWSGERYSRPDRDAITSKVGWGNGLAAACGTSSNPDVGALQPIPGIDNWTQAGSVGCDVCGVLRDGTIWVVLPPESVSQRQFEVQLSNGDKRAFQIKATDARALSIELPPPPAGTLYKSGRVRIL